jgi:hypothetical protein
LWRWISLNICYATSHFKDEMSQPTFGQTPAELQCTQRQSKAKKKSSGKPQKTQEIQTRQFCGPFD